MAFPTFVGHSGAEQHSTAALTVTNNAGAATGDYEILIIETMDEAASLTTANGFTAHPGSPVSAPHATDALLRTRLTAFERIWNGTDGDPITNDPGNHIGAQIFTFRRSTGTWSTLADARSATQGIGWETSHEEVDDGTGEWPDIASAEATDLLICGFTCHSKPDVVGGTAELSGITNANLASITEQYDDAHASGNGGWIGAFTGTKTGGGAPGTTTYTKATAAYKAHLVIALRDSAPAAGISFDVGMIPF